jgi:2-polyprenyl-3-methyl-5-hydroxy-6-metoxy-1,4-benzoquinol methylase
MELKSTLILSGSTRIVDVVEVETLIKDYQNSFKLDISRFFNGISEVIIYQCIQTGYKFYYPFDITGDSDFYKHLQQFDWYYMPWKWEHNITKKLLSGNEKILEIGCGGLGFVENLFKSGYDITGLELNEESIVKANKLGVNVLNETVQAHATNNFEIYDLVCSYQVLEHISEVNSFIKSQINCLKKGGKLIISVPNNDSFLKLNKGGILNFPPHHMGLWNKKSLTSLADLFDLKIDKVFFEPLQEYHLDWYINTMINYKINKNKMTRFIFEKFKLKKIYTRIIKKIKGKIHGHSIMVIYTKV